MEGRYYLVFIFSIIHYVQAQQGFISLDCGLPTNDSPYIEPVTGLVFSSDADHIQSGNSSRIQKSLETFHIKPYLFLRYFPDGVRNCYTLDVLQNVKYLIRAVFVYGNYDGFSDYPSFDLYLGPNKWARVDLEGKVNGTVEEIIHIPRSNSLQICLVKTGNSLPFISALELRLLRNDTYVVQDVSLKHLFRRYHRQSDRLIRYPDDVFDRIWSPFFLPEWRQITTSLDVNNSNNFEPPKAALKSAAIPREVDERQLTINWTLDNPTEKVHLYFHFAELEPFVANKSSSPEEAKFMEMLNRKIFSIVINGNVTVESFVPLNLAISTVDTVVKNCDGGKCSVQLVSKANLPLINAMEAFTAIKFPHSETEPGDVGSIKILQDTYGLNKTDWQGDPCSPQQYLWSGINCNYMNMSTSPRIISLNLSSEGLTGKIVPHIQNLTQLQILDLSNNKLTGGVPEFLANMKSLLFINLSNNNLEGSIPRALLDRDKPKLYFEGNPKICAVDSCKSSGGNKEIKIIVPVATAVATFIVVSVLIVVFRKKRPSSIRALHSGPTNLLLEGKMRRISYSEIQLVTNNFERVIGEGGFGVVYHAYLDDKQQVAVKVLSPSSSQGYKQFKAEVELLLRVHHTNLVSLVGYCDEQTHLALVHEYMSNGDLKAHLSGKYGDCVLYWANRLRIAVETALASGCKLPMVHRDVKSVNILLDEHLQAKLADFGLSRSFSIGDETHVSTGVVGTPGYLDPEYYKTHRLTEKSDVYSFGIVLLEIITNQPVIDQANEHAHIAERVGNMLRRGDIKTIVDPSLHDEYDSGSVWKAIELAMSCVNPTPVARPDMSHVVHELKECMKAENLRAGLSQVTESKSSLDQDMSSDSGMTPNAR